MTATPRKTPATKSKPRTIKRLTKTTTKAKSGTDGDVTVPRKTAEQLKALANQYLLSRRARDGASQEMSAAASDLTGILDGLGIDTYSTGDAKITVVTPTSTVLDEDRLKKALTDKQWEQITNRVIDKAKLQAAVKAGDIPAATIAKVSKYNTGMSYPRVTPL